MRCPYCSNEMIKGYIYGDRYMLKWLPEEKDLFLGIWANGGIELGKREGLIGRAAVEASMCQSCNKLIIDTNVKK
ncbi:PF20097 family protein [Clostridium weizhouense]|uniref:DUF6487 domain-containing protein n=1 Tax=Clostridium weizhouense TaxID=2859781 RepID=A0ABS7AQX3_9CLOT|nr:PF20097 family protein [Clostridium weizhouense]MBW6411066.1 hypothetical protein [Clostridium weizhouense]